MIPVAGFGTRFLPATKVQPKEMLPIVDTPAIQLIVEEALASGIEEILIITDRNKRVIEDHFDTSVELEQLLQAQGKQEQLNLVRRLADIKIHFIRQKAPIGLGDAVLCAKSFIGDEFFAVLLSDDIVFNPERLCLKQLMDCYEEHPGIILGTQFVSEEQVSSYGIVEGHPLKERLYKVDGLVEKPAKEDAPSQLAVIGRYILSPEIFAQLEVLQPGVGNEIQLTDAISTVAVDKFALVCQGDRYDTGDPLGFLKASIEYGLRNENIKEELKEYLANLDLSRDFNKL